MRCWLSLVMLLSAGCLPDPEPNEWQETTFPPSSMNINLIGGEVVDVDGDGVDDMVLRNDPCAATAPAGTACSDTAQGFFVMRGRPGRGLGGYFSFTPTPDTRPFAVHFRDIDGDGDKDALVFGPDPDATSGVLAAHTALAPASFGPADLAALNQALPPELVEGRPDLIADVELDGDEFPDLVVARWGTLFSLEVEHTGSAFKNNTFLAIGPSDAMAVAIASVPSASSGVDDLIVDGRGETFWLKNDGGGGFLETLTNGGAPGDVDAPDHTAFFHDMDGDGVLDVLGAGNDIIRVTTTGKTDESFLFDNTRNRAYGRVIAFTRAPLNGDTRPDAVGVREHGGSCPCTYTVDSYVDFEIDESDGSLEESAVGLPSLDVPSGVVPVAAGIGDFDASGSTDVVLFEQDGDRTCATASDRSVVETEC